MQVSVETTQGLERRMTVSVPADRIENEIENRLKNLSRTAKLKGFRPGKVPMRVVESRYGPAVRQEVVDEITRSSFYEAINRENLQLAGMPHFESRVVEPGKDLEYKAVFEVLVPVEPAPMDQVEIARPVAEITEQDVDAMVENLRRQRGEWVDVERPAREQDRVRIDFAGTIDGEEFPGNRGEQVPLLIGAGRFIEGFEKGLIGASAGEKRILDLQFPDDYHVATVAGKPVRFEINLHAVSELSLPGLDEEFIRSFNVADGTIETMRAELRKTMQDEMEEAIREKVKKQALDALFRENPIEVPRTQVETQSQLLMNQMREYLQSQGLADAEVKLEPRAFEEQAKRRVVLGILVNEIVKRQGLTATPEQIRRRIEAIASGYENPAEAVQWYYADRKRLTNIEQLVLEDLVVEWVMSQVRVSEERTDFETLLKERKGQ